MVLFATTVQSKYFIWSLSLSLSLASDDGFNLINRIFLSRYIEFCLFCSLYFCIFFVNCFCKISSLDFYEIPFKLSPDLCIRYLCWHIHCSSDSCLWQVLARSASGCWCVWFSRFSTWLLQGLASLPSWSPSWLAAFWRFHSCSVCWYCSSRMLSKWNQNFGIEWQSHFESLCEKCSLTLRSWESLCDTDSFIASRSTSGCWSVCTCICRTGCLL